MRRPDFIARQSGQPSGWLGRLLLRLMAHETRGLNGEVVAALAPAEGDRILEVGFGHGTFPCATTGRKRRSTRSQHPPSGGSDRTLRSLGSGHLWDAQRDAFAYDWGTIRRSRHPSTARALSLLALVATGCAPETARAPERAHAKADAPWTWAAGPALPEPLANNAVAAVETASGCTLITALGLGAPRADSITTHAYAWTAKDAGWRRLDDVPGTPRVAASAVTVHGRVHVLGGYDVAPDGHETSHREMVVLDATRGTWTNAAPLPQAIDDAVAVAWRDRWIVVVSGWSNDAPVATVQVFDSETNAWASATPFPGTPVFGHAGALDGDELVIVDGVAKGASGYAIVNQAWAGRLDAEAPIRIAWRDLGAHPGPARYRAAAGATPRGALVFQGGTDDPYNYDGKSYLAHRPSAPLADALVFEPARQEFRLLSAPKPRATMDHRGLAGCDGRLFTIGGMTAGGSVLSEVWSFGP
jgi:hypothetical protein